LSFPPLLRWAKLGLFPFKKTESWGRADVTLPPLSVSPVSGPSLFPFFRRERSLSFVSPRGFFRSMEIWGLPFSFFFGGVNSFLFLPPCEGFFPLFFRAESPSFDFFPPGISRPPFPKQILVPLFLPPRHGKSPFSPPPVSESLFPGSFFSAGAVFPLFLLFFLTMELTSHPLFSLLGSTFRTSFFFSGQGNANRGFL